MHICNMTSIGDNQRAWLKHLCEKYGTTVTEIAERSNLSASTLTRFMNSKRTEELRISTLRKIEKVFGSSGIAPEFLPGRRQGFEDKPALFGHGKRGPDAALLEEAASYGLDPAEIARSAVERAVKTERLKRFSEENREAIQSWNDLVEREGLWSDGLRAF
jgi:transcriptional regulator with XRE-family HTH domain